MGGGEGGTTSDDVTMSSTSKTTSTSSYFGFKASPAPSNADSDISRALKRRLSEKMVRATTATYRALRATVKEGQSTELSNVPRVFATKQSAMLKTQQLLNSMPKVLAEIDEMYDVLERRLS